MSYGAIHKFKSRAYGSLAYLFYLFRMPDTLYMRIRAEFKIDIIRVLYHALREFLAYKRRKVSPYIGGKRKFSVGESACTRKTRRYVARFAGKTFFRLCLRTFSVFYRTTFFQNRYLPAVIVLYKFKSGKYSGGSRSDYQNIGFHNLYLRNKFYFCVSFL